MRKLAVLLFASAGLITGIAMAWQPPAPPAPAPPAPAPRENQPDLPVRGPGERWTSERGPGQHRPGEREVEGRQPSVEGSMKGMARAMRALRKQVSDPAKRDENLKLINDMQRSCLYAKSQPLPPDILKDAKDDAAKAKLGAAYHAKLIDAMRLMLDVESELAEGKHADAKISLEELIDLRDDIHKELGVKDD